MTEAEKNERIKAVEEQMGKLQKELEDIRNSDTTPEWDFSLWDDFELRKKYEFDIPAHLFTILQFKDKLDMLKKLMRFKFCYDSSYAPDWSKPDEHKWFVYFNTQDEKYNYGWTATWDQPSTVYFSREEIAQKCADWLNAGCPGYSEEVK